jgi:hypothetical protein
MNLFNAMGQSKKHFAKFRHLQNQVKKLSRKVGGQVVSMQRQLEAADIPSGDGIRRHKKTVPLKFRM